MNNANIDFEKQIEKNVIEKIAAYNLKEELNNKINENENKRSHTQIIYIILSAVAVFILCGIVVVDNNIMQNSIFIGAKETNDNELNNESVENTISVSTTSNIEYILNTVDKDKIFYTNNSSDETSCFAYEPNIENLYKNSSIVFVGSFIEDVESYNDAPLIRTKTKFSVSQVLKNSSDINIEDTIEFDRLGGVLTLEEYMKDNPYIREDEFTDVSANKRDEYYIIQDEIPIDKKDKLDFSNNEAKYIVFLEDSGNVLRLNTGYYGIRVLNSENEIYDYDTDKYIDNEVSQMIK